MSHKRFLFMHLMDVRTLNEMWVKSSFDPKKVKHA